jgi:hypothetical protein
MTFLRGLGLGFLLATALAAPLGCEGSEAAEPTSTSTQTDPPAPSAFASQVVSFTPGPGAGFGADKLPGIVAGPPHGGGLGQGSLDVLSLGAGGEIILGFAERVVDGEGPDFIVFENPFQVGGTTKVFEELGEIAISDDGVSWIAYPCEPATKNITSCAGRTPVLSSPDNGIAATDPTLAGGDAFDLATLGLTSARFVRIRDKSPAAAGVGETAGFDLDAVAIVHGAPLSNLGRHPRNDRLDA